VSLIGLLAFFPGKQPYPRAQITVTTTAGAVHKEVDGLAIGQARRQVKRFNELADAAAGDTSR
jgi:hypothetical protein